MSASSGSRPFRPLGYDSFRYSGANRNINPNLLLERQLAPAYHERRLQSPNRRPASALSTGPPSSSATASVPASSSSSPHFTVSAPPESLQYHRVDAKRRQLAEERKLRIEMENLHLAERILQIGKSKGVKNIPNLQNGKQRPKTANGSAGGDRQMVQSNGNHAAAVPSDSSSSSSASYIPVCLPVTVPINTTKLQSCISITVDNARYQHRISTIRSSLPPVKQMLAQYEQHKRLVHSLQKYGKKSSIHNQTGKGNRNRLVSSSSSSSSSKPSNGKSRLLKLFPQLANLLDSRAAQQENGQMELNSPEWDGQLEENEEESWITSSDDDEDANSQMERDEHLDLDLPLAREEKEEKETEKEEFSIPMPNSNDQQNKIGADQAQQQQTGSLPDAHSQSQSADSSVAQSVSAAAASHSRSSSHSGAGLVRIRLRPSPPVSRPRSPSASALVSSDQANPPLRRPRSFKLVSSASHGQSAASSLDISRSSSASSLIAIAPRASSIPFPVPPPRPTESELHSGPVEIIQIDANIKSLTNPTETIEAALRQVDPSIDSSPNYPANPSIPITSSLIRYFVRVHESIHPWRLDFDFYPFQVSTNANSHTMTRPNNVPDYQLSLPFTQLIQLIHKHYTNTDTNSDTNAQDEVDSHSSSQSHSRFPPDFLDTLLSSPNRVELLRILFDRKLFLFRSPSSDSYSYPPQSSSDSAAGALEIRFCRSNSAALEWQRREEQKRLEDIGKSRNPSSNVSASASMRPEKRGIRIKLGTAPNRNRNSQQTAKAAHVEAKEPEAQSSARDEPVASDKPAEPSAKEQTSTIEAADAALGNPVYRPELTAEQVAELLETPNLSREQSKKELEVPVQSGPQEDDQKSVSPSAEEHENRDSAVPESSEPKVAQLVDGVSQDAAISAIVKEESAVSATPEPSLSSSDQTVVDPPATAPSPAE